MAVNKAVHKPLIIIYNTYRIQITRAKIQRIAYVP